jgi:hypothetical protein
LNRQSTSGVRDYPVKGSSSSTGRNSLRVTPELLALVVMHTENYWQEFIPATATVVSLAGKARQVLVWKYPFLIKPICISERKWLSPTASKLQNDKPWGKKWNISTLFLISKEEILTTFLFCFALYFSVFVSLYYSPLLFLIPSSHIHILSFLSCFFFLFPCLSLFIDFSHYFLQL